MRRGELGEGGDQEKLTTPTFSQLLLRANKIAVQFVSHGGASPQGRLHTHARTRAQTKARCNCFARETNCNATFFARKQMQCNLFCVQVLTARVRFGHCAC